MTKQALINEMFRQYNQIRLQEKHLPKLSKAKFIKQVQLDSQEFQDAYDKWKENGFIHDQKPTLSIPSNAVKADMQFELLWTKYVKDHPHIEKLDPEHQAQAKMDLFKAMEKLIKSGELDKARRLQRIKKLN